MYIGGINENTDNSINEDVEIINEDESIVTLPPKAEASDKPNKDIEESNSDFTQNQVTGLVALVWIILIISVIVLIVGSTISNKKSKSEINKIDSNFSYNCVAINSIQVEDASYKDYVVINKSMLINDGNITPSFVGTAENYKRKVVIPVTLIEYNSINNNSRIEVVFSRLNISGEEKIYITSWSVI